MGVLTRRSLETGQALRFARGAGTAFWQPDGR